MLLLAANADAREDVSGVAIDRVRIAESGSAAARDVAWSELSSPKKPGGIYSIEIRVPAVAGAEAILIPHCNGRRKITIDAVVKDPGSKGTRVFRFAPSSASEHLVTVEVEASTYEKRIACSSAPYVGVPIESTDGLSLLRFDSPPAAMQRGGGEAVMFIPGGHDITKPSALLMGTHPWNGGPWTYAAYKELIEEAAKNDLVLLMPSGLGNSLYVAEAEDEVWRAHDALTSRVVIDPQRMSIWGASMGGAGATTISFHRPDRFAFVASYFGDSRYDLNTYVKNVLGGEEGARRVNALDHLENARHLPVFLVHGEDDRTSPMYQSTMLYDAMKKAGFDVSLIREPGMAHEGPLVVKYIRRVVDRAAVAIAPSRPSRVSFRSVRPQDVDAYGVHLRRSSSSLGRDGFVDLERRKDGVHVLQAEGVAEIVLTKGALGAADEAAIKYDVASPPKVTWR